jgi:hypothetical protein
MRTTLFLASSILMVACAWGEESGPPTDDPEIPVCGDGTCASSETNSCVSDCGTPNPVTCNNNGTCDTGETTSNCANDCSPATQCGNNVCETGEDTTSCPNDCTSSSIDCDDLLIQAACIACALGTCSGVTIDECLACALGGGAGGCSGGLPNGTCDGGEDSTTCPPDCP